VGVVSVVAGNGNCGFNLESGPATSVSLYTPAGLALDEVKNVLYIADYNNVRVRVLDLTANTLATYAGNGTPTCTGGCGDGGPATMANLGYPQGLTLSPDRSTLYLSDGSYGPGHNRLRMINTSTNVINAVPAWGVGSCTTSTVVLSGCDYDKYGCDVAFDSAGTMYVSATLCGTSPNGTYPGGIVLVNTNNTLVHVAGSNGGSLNNVVTPPTMAAFGNNAASNAIPSITFDANNNLWLVDRLANVVREISGGNGSTGGFVGGTLTTTGGTSNMAGYAGDYAPQSQALFSLPMFIRTTAGGHLAIAEYSNYGIRYIW
jgi:hypothetical protein